jgi:perosamine synthetase
MISDRVPAAFDTDSEAILDVLRRGQLSGKADIVAEYEAALAQEFGARFAVAVSSGSSALMAGLYASGVRPGDRVLVSALAPPPTVMPILVLGAQPVFVDCLRDSFDFDMQDLAGKSEGARAVLAVHLWGYPTALAELRAFADENRVALIEDAAQAHYSWLDMGGFAGTVGDFGCFSTQERKLLSTGEGGFVLTDEEARRDALRNYITIGGVGGNGFGINGKLAALPAGLGRSRLAHARAEAAIRRERLERLRPALARATVREMACTGDAALNGYAMVLMAPSAAAGAALSRRLEEAGIPSEVTRYSVTVAYEKMAFRQWRTPCPNAESLVARLATVPVHSGLSEAELDLIHSVIERSGRPG